MVGDVKQSIYKFRQAMPELFLNKYKTYKLKKEKSEADDLKIQLFKNFRSRKNILDTTNIIFQEIMSKDLGDVDYNEDEYLNLGANYEEPQLENIDFAGKTEINIINLEDTTKDIQEDEEDNVKTERIENSILEARYVAQKINELINSNYYVLDKKPLKGIQPTTASIYINLQPIIASVVAILIGQDIFSWDEPVSAILVISGVLLVSHSQNKK